LKQLSKVNQIYAAQSTNNPPNQVKKIERRISQEGRNLRPAVSNRELRKAYVI
jgi:hypothetical protein